MIGAKAIVVVSSNGKGSLSVRSLDRFSLKEERMFGARMHLHHFNVHNDANSNANTYVNFNVDGDINFNVDCDANFNVGGDVYFDVGGCVNINVGCGFGNTILRNLIKLWFWETSFCKAYKKKWLWKPDFVKLTKNDGFGKRNKLL